MTFSRVLVVAIFSCLPLAVLHADGSPNAGFILLIDDDAPGAEAMLDSRFGDAVEAAATTNRQDEQLSARMVLCAALIASGDLDAAVEVCDEAVELARAPITTGMNPHGHSDREALAMAYSNRAVLRWLRGNVDGADADVTRALRQNRHANEVRHNRQVGTSAALASND